MPASTSGPRRCLTRSTGGGLIAETERLLAKYGDQARPLASLGYKQAMQFLRGELDRESALAAAQQAHRNYAKRQITWFRREPDVHWLAGFGDDPAIQAEGIATVEPGNLRECRAQLGRARTSLRHTICYCQLHAPTSAADRAPVSRDALLCERQEQRPLSAARSHPSRQSRPEMGRQDVAQDVA